MLNIHGFYDQFSPRVKSFLLSERARIEKDVQNLIKLASWKDVNVYALKQSAIRSHHQLYKSVRKLRAVLQKPASDFFTVPELDRSLVISTLVSSLRVRLHRTDAMSNSAAPMLLDPTDEPELPLIPSALVSPTDPSHIVRLDQTLNRLRSIVRSSIDPFVTLDRATLVDELAVQIITTSKALRAESTLGEEEGREARVKALATRKRRAWIELLRELKRLGLSHTPAPETVARLQDSGVVYALPASRDLLDLDPSLLDSSLRSQLIKADDYHFRLLSEMPLLRNYPAEHNADVSTREIQRAIGSFESCIALGFENRSQIVVAVAAHVRFSRMVDRLEQLSTDGGRQPTQTSRFLAETLLDLVSKVIDALSETRRELANHRAALRNRTTDVSSVDSAVAGAKSVLVVDQEQLIEILDRMVSVDPVLTSPTELVIFQSIRDHLIKVASDLRSPCPPALDYLIQPLAVWVNTLSIPLIQADDVEMPPPAADLSVLKANHTTLVDSILVIAQELRKLAEKDVPTDEGGDIPDLGIKITGRTLQSTLAVFRLSEIQDQVTTLAQNLHSALASPTISPSVTILLRRVLPFLQQYSSLIGRHLSAFLDWHKASLKLAYVVSAIVKELALEGFCRPNEDDGEEGAAGKTTDGTGMADGQGATNVSKEIEDEEQIEGLQGEVPKKEEKEEQKEGDDDAVEMKDDFEGEMEDRGDGEKEEDSDDDDDDDKKSEADPEEQIADVDPLDPSSVDEKFWGDEESKESGSNEEINQETTKSAGESEMAAKEDEAPKPKPKGEEESGEAEPDAKDEEATDRPAAEDGQEMDGEGDDGETNEEEDGKDEEGNEGEEDEGEAAQQEDGQRLDDRMPEADNLDLPDDMQLDGDEKKEDDDDLDLGSDMGGQFSPVSRGSLHDH